jgi:hypothetical protein
MEFSPDQVFDDCVVFIDAIGEDGVSATNTLAAKMTEEGSPTWQM